MIFLDESDIGFLMQLGLTKTQAKVYLTLLKLDVANARTLYKNTDVPRPEIYRSLDELQKMGLVEKEISTPLKFHAPPLELCIQILMAKREQKYKEFKIEAREFLRKIKKIKQPQSKKRVYDLFMITGMQRIEQLITKQHSNVKKEVDILTTSTRWLRILEFCSEYYFKALERGVNYHVFVEDANNQIRYNEDACKLISNPNFHLKVGKSPLKTNLAIFDQTEATVNFFPSQPLKKSPLIVIRHPSFIQMCQDHFHMVWNKVLEPTLLS